MISGRYAYVIEGVANESDILHILDITNPVDPQELGTHTFNASDLVWDLVIDDDILYVANDDGGLRLLDVSDPLNPQEAGTYNILAAMDIVVRNDVAFLASGDWEGGFLTLDVSDPTSPSLIGLYEDLGFISVRVDVSGNYAFVSEYEYLYLFDISSLQNPILLDSIELSQICTELTAMDNLAFLSNADAGIQVFQNTLIQTSPTPHISPSPTHTPTAVPPQVPANSPFGILVLFILFSAFYGYLILKRRLLSAEVSIFQVHRKGERYR